MSAEQRRIARVLCAEHTARGDNRRCCRFRTPGPVRRSAAVGFWTRRCGGVRKRRAGGVLCFLFYAFPTFSLSRYASLLCYSCSFARGCAPPRARRGGSPFRYAAQIDRIAAHRVRHCANKKTCRTTTPPHIANQQPPSGVSPVRPLQTRPRGGVRISIAWRRVCKRRSRNAAGECGGRRTPPTMQAVGTDLTTICPRCPGWASAHMV